MSSTHAQFLKRLVLHPFACDFQNIGLMRAMHTCMMWAWALDSFQLARRALRSGRKKYAGIFHADTEEAFVCCSWT